MMKVWTSQDLSKNTRVYKEEDVEDFLKCIISQIELLEEQDSDTIDLELALQQDEALSSICNELYREV